MSEALEPTKKDYRDLDRITPTTEELISENIDGEIFLYRAIPQCKVCTSGDEVRRYVDDLLLYPKGYKDILRTIQPLEEKLGVEPEDRISYSSIRTHYRNHLPLDKKQVREVIERKANKNNTSIIDAEGTLLTPEAFYEVVVAKGFEDIVSGAAKPTLSQTFQAMGILQRMEEKEKSGYKPEVLVNQLNIILQAIRDVLPVEWREKVFDKIQLYSEEAQKLPTTMEIAEAQEYIDDDLS